jgi:hypothetical protein
MLWISMTEEKALEKAFTRKGKTRRNKWTMLCTFGGRSKGERDNVLDGDSLVLTFSTRLTRTPEKHAVWFSGSLLDLGVPYGAHCLWNTRIQHIQNQYHYFIFKSPTCPPWSGKYETPWIDEENDSSPDMEYMTARSRLSFFAILDGWLSHRHAACGWLCIHNHHLTCFATTKLDNQKLPPR